MVSALVLGLGVVFLHSARLCAAGWHWRIGSSQMAGLSAIEMQISCILSIAGSFLLEQLKSASSLRRCRTSC
jgi:hypothetical protein